jgi:hypothetical protein
MQKRGENMQKTIIFLCTLLVTPVPGAWAQAAQAGSSQDVKQITEDLVQTITARTIATTIGNTTAGNTFVFVGGQLFNGKPVKGQPYSAEAVTESTQTLGDGNRIVNRSSTMMYRDSEGRERREESIGKLGAWSAQGEPAKVVFISDPVAKMSYTLHTADRTAERMNAEFNAVAPRPGMAATAGTIGPSGDIAIAYKAGAAAADADKLVAEKLQIAAGRGGRGGRGNSKVEQLGSQTFDGVPADGTRTTQTIPAGQIGNERDINVVSERWFSKDLGVVVMSKQSDPRMGETVYKLTNIIRNEPLHSMFEVPSDYTVSDSASMREQKMRQEKLQFRKDDQQ